MRYILLLSAFLPIFVGAQHQVQGFVIKTDGTPVRSIAAKIKKLDATGFSISFITDSSGGFSFQIADTGAYVLNLQSLFYRDTSLLFHISMTDQYKHLGAITLQELSKTLATVTVTAEKAALEFKEDHIALIPAADPSIGARPVTEILFRIPGISIDARNKITAKGDESVQLLVNGRMIRSSAGDYLSQLNADEVERIELFDNATRYAYIKAPVILNVILKNKQPKKLWNATLNSNTLPKLNPSVDASFAIGKRQRVYARLSHDRALFRSAGYLTRTRDSFHLYQDYDNRVHHQMTTGRLGWDYLLDSAKTLTIEGNYTLHTDALHASIRVRTPGEVFQNTIRSAPDEKEFNGFITYKWDQKQKGHKLIELSLANFTLQNRRNLPGVPMSEQRQMRNYSVGGKAEWQRNWKQYTFLHGVFGQLVTIRDAIDTVAVSGVLKSRFSNNSITAYHEGNRQWKKWSFTAGVNIDIVQMQLHRLEKESFSFRKAFVNPSLRISNTNGKRRTTVSYHRKYILPATHLMFGQYSQYEYERTAPGNYRLQPATQDLVKFSLTSTKKATVLFELYYDLTKNPVILLNRIHETAVIEHPENLQSRKSMGAVFSLSYTVWPFYGFTLNMDGRLNNYVFKEQVYAHNPKTWSGSATLVHRFTLHKKLSISLNTSLHNWRTTLYRDIQSFFIYTLQGNYRMNPRTNLSFGVNDIFNNMILSYTGTIAPGYYEGGYGNHKVRYVSFSIRYQLINSQLDKKATTLKSFLSE